MTSATGERQDVSAYLEALGRCLDDIPPDERQDVLEDLEAHLAEVAAESDEPLASRLGEPEAYAAELRASAGYGPARTAVERASLLSRVDRRWHALGDHRWVRPVLDFLPELRPGWWVVRGAGAVVAWAILVGHGNRGDLPIPSTFGGRLPTLLLMIAAAVLSVRLGRRSATGQLRRLTPAGQRRDRRRAPDGRRAGAVVRRGLRAIRRQRPARGRLPPGA